MPIVWIMPDGSVRTTHIVEDVLAHARRPEETVEQTVLRLATIIQAKTPSLTGGVAHLVTTAEMPADRSQRFRWRKHPSGRGILVDPSIPTPPHPRQALLNELATATTLTDLKLVLQKVLE